MSKMTPEEKKLAKLEYAQPKSSNIRAFVLEVLMCLDDFRFDPDHPMITLTETPRQSD